MASAEEQQAWVLRVLGVDTGAGPAGPGTGAAVRLAKGMLAWNRTRAEVGQQIRLLQDTIRADTRSLDDHDEICANLGDLEEILEVLDDRLLGVMDQMRGTEDAGLKATLSDQARTIVKGYEAYLASDELINAIDDNGFVALDIRPRVAAGLAAVAVTI